MDAGLIGKQIPWKSLEKEFARVVHFTPQATVEGNRVQASSVAEPYGLLEVESPKIRGRAIMPLGHKLDFLHAWEVWVARGVAEAEEVLVAYQRPSDYYSQDFTIPVLRALVRTLVSLVEWTQPRLHFLVCRRGYLERLYARQALEPAIQRWEPRTGLRKE